MKIGIVGVGHIGKTLALRLSEVGHEVSVANSKGPESIDKEVLLTGAKAATAKEAILNKEVVILSIPLNSIPEIAVYIKEVSNDTTVIDTSNYYPARDGRIKEIEAGKIESLWVAEQLGRPVAKAWNAIGSDSLAKKGKSTGSDERIAIPIATDREKDYEITSSLVNDTGFDTYHSGSLRDSWRQQPGAPAYCTDLTLNELQNVIDKAQKSRLPKRRDLAVAAIQERMGDPKTNPDADYGVRLSRVLNM